MAKFPNPFARGGKKKNKYGARPTGTHASRKEHNRAGELKLWERAGIISNLREQVPYLLIPAQYGDAGTDLNGKPVKVLLEHPVKYIADFVYELDGKTVVEDTKGFKTREYILKRKLMLYRYGIRIKEV